MQKRCVCCGKTFKQRPQVPDQAFCASPDCQRARKRQWQRTKLQSDPDYRTNQRAAQQAWSQRNRDYWRTRRDTRPKYPSHTHERQRSRAHDPSDLAKMDVCDLPTGLYRIARHPKFSMENSNLWVIEITPVRLTCLRKMDVSREDVIDASPISS